MELNKNTNVQCSYPVETLAESNARLLQRVAQLEHEATQARHLAYHDSLTGLPNRALLLDRLKQAMLQAERQHKAVGLLLLDLDRFKSVNDQLGHNAGDLILQRVAARLSGCIRGCDTACRYGGDEFVILLPEVRGTEDVEAVVVKVRASLAIPHRLGEHVVEVGASIGTAVFKEGGASCGELIGAADAAMYRAKARFIG
jgi:diguanylate cyclase